MTYPAYTGLRMSPVIVCADSLYLRPRPRGASPGGRHRGRTPAQARPAHGPWGLTAHDSHGVVLLPTYVDRIDRKHIMPTARAEILNESGPTVPVNGGWGFGS